MELFLFDSRNLSGALSKSTDTVIHHEGVSNVVRRIKLSFAGDQETYRMKIEWIHCSITHDTKKLLKPEWMFYMVDWYCGRGLNQGVIKSTLRQFLKLLILHIHFMNILLISHMFEDLIMILPCIMRSEAWWGYKGNSVHKACNTECTDLPSK